MLTLLTKPKLTQVAHKGIGSNYLSHMERQSGYPAAACRDFADKLKWVPKRPVRRLGARSEV